LINHNLGITLDNARDVYIPISIPSNVKENGLSTIHALPKATEYDTILCAEVADVDWDGKNELILGTFGKVC